MKKSSFVLLALLVGPLAFAGTSFSLNGRDIIRIESDDSIDSYEDRAMSLQELRDQNRKLRKRLNRLEKAVRQMQDRVFNLEAAPVNTAPRAPKIHSCYISTSFDGTLTAQGSSEAEARGKVLNECHKKTSSSVFCSEIHVKCGSSE